MMDYRQKNCATATRIVRGSGLLRRAATMTELIVAISILSFVMTMVVQCAIYGGRAHRETDRQDAARLRCGRALDRAIAVEKLSDDSLASISGLCSSTNFNVSVRRMNAQGDSVTNTSSPSDVAIHPIHLVAEATWKNDAGVAKSLVLHGWRPAPPQGKAAP